MVLKHLCDMLPSKRDMSGQNVIMQGFLVPGNPLHIEQAPVVLNQFCVRAVLTY